MRSNVIRVSHTVAFMLAGIVLAAVLTKAQTPTTGPILRLTATTENVAGAPDSIRIDLLRWSTDAERDQLLSAWSLTGAPAAGGRGAAGGGRGARGDGARGAGGRGGRGGADAAEAPRQTPESSLAAALEKAPTLGYLWSSESSGYALRYAGRLPQPDGERIILITNRRLGAWNNLWKPVGSAAATDYEFSIVELHLNSKGEGEGKTSLTGKVAVDSAAKMIGLENYSALPVVLKGVKRRAN
ncbi:MAG TPA: hypothetical protein VE422_45160 [Terriglobia bacterium]|nr:hypothetical protein [Terriglobia bacterium]